MSVKVPNPQRALASAVLLKAAKDLRSKNPEERRAARAFFRPENEWFSFWCEAAELDSNRVLARAKRLGRA